MQITPILRSALLLFALTSLHPLVNGDDIEWMQRYAHSFVVKNGVLSDVNVSMRRGIELLPLSRQSHQIDSLTVSSSAVVEVSPETLLNSFSNLSQLEIEAPLGLDPAISTAGYFRFVHSPSIESLKVGLLTPRGAPAMPLQNRQSAVKHLSLGVSDPTGVAKLVSDLSLHTFELRCLNTRICDSSLMQALSRMPDLSSVSLFARPGPEKRFLDLQPLSRLRKLDRLELQNAAIDPHQLLALTGLTELRISNCKFSKSPDGALFQHPTLKTLTLQLQPLDDLNISAPVVTTASTLEKLSLEQPRLSDLALLSATPCRIHVSVGTTVPHYLNLADAPFLTPCLQHSLTEADVKLLQQVEGLRELSIVYASTSGDYKIPAPLAIKIASSLNLDALTIHAPIRNGGSMRPLTESHLEELRLSTFPSFSQDAISAFFNPRLRRAAFEFPVEPHAEADLDVTSLKRLTDLGVRFVGYTSQSNGQFANLCKSPITRLLVSDSVVTPQSLEAITSSHETLKTLVFHECQFPNPHALLRLNDIPQLVSIRFADSRVPPAVVRDLRTTVQCTKGDHSTGLHRAGSESGSLWFELNESPNQQTGQSP